MRKRKKTKYYVCICEEGMSVHECVHVCECVGIFMYVCAFFVVVVVVT